MYTLDDIKAARSTDALADVLDAYCDKHGLPLVSADDLLAEYRAHVAWLAYFCDQWERVQEREDFDSAIAARGER